MTKTELFEAALRAGGDLGGKSVDDLVKLMGTGEESPYVFINEIQSDPISAIIYNAFTRVDKRDIADDLSYAIIQLNKALETVIKTPMD